MKEFRYCDHGLHESDLTGLQLDSWLGNICHNDKDTSDGLNRMRTASCTFACMITPRRGLAVDVPMENHCRKTVHHKEP